MRCFGHLQNQEQMSDKRPQEMRPATELPSLGGHISTKPNDVTLSPSLFIQLSDAEWEVNGRRRLQSCHRAFRPRHFTRANDLYVRMRSLPCDARVRDTFMLELLIGFRFLRVTFAGPDHSICHSH